MASVAVYLSMICLFSKRVTLPRLLIFLSILLASCGGASEPVAEVERISQVDQLEIQYSDLPEDPSLCRYNEQQIPALRDDWTPRDFADVHGHLEVLNRLVLDSRLEVALVRGKPVAVVLEGSHAFRIQGETKAGQDAFQCPYDPLKFIELTPLVLKERVVALDARKDLQDPDDVAELIRRLGIFGLYHIAPEEMVYEVTPDHLGQIFARAEENKLIVWTLSDSYPMGFTKDGTIPRFRFYYVREAK